MNRRDILVAGLLATGLTAMLAPLASLGLDFHHDGIMLKPALDVLSGQVLFRDTFMQYGALSCYLEVAALWVQPTLVSVKLLTVAAYGVTLFFLYASWRLILPRSLTILSCGLFILFIPSYEQDWSGHPLIFNPWSSVFAMMFQSLGLYALFRIICGKQSHQWGLILGVTCACVLWCRQPVGLIMTGCVVVVGVALHCTNWESGPYAKASILGRVAGGFIAINAVMLGGILLSGSRSAWWYQNFVWPKKWAEAMHGNWSYILGPLTRPATGAGLLLLMLAASLPALAKRSRLAPSTRSITLYYIFLGVLLAWQSERVLPWFRLRLGGWTSLLPLVIFLHAIYCLVRALLARKSPQPTVYYLSAALSALSLGSILQYYPVPDSWHVLWSLAPAFGLFVFACWQWCQWRPAILSAVLILLLLPSIWTKAKLMTQALQQPVETLEHPAVLRGMKLPPQQARFVRQVADTVAQVLQYQPAIPSALLGDDALFLCLTTNRTNPTPYFVTWPDLARKEDEKMRWHYIFTVRPLLFVHKINRASINQFYRDARYTPVLTIPEEEFEIAIPQEVAETMKQNPPPAPR